MNEIPEERDAGFREGLTTSRDLTWSTATRQEEWRTHAPATACTVVGLLHATRLAQGFSSQPVGAGGGMGAKGGRGGFVGAGLGGSGLGGGTGGCGGGPGGGFTTAASAGSAAAVTVDATPASTTDCATKPLSTTSPIDATTLPVDMSEDTGTATIAVTTASGCVLATALAPPTIGMPAAARRLARRPVIEVITSAITSYGTSEVRFTTACVGQQRRSG